MNAKTKILIVEHDPTDLELLHRELKKGGINYVAEIVQNEQDYSNAITNFSPDIILSDYSLPSFDGPTAFKVKERMAPDTPFIFVSGTIGEENSIELIKSGVTDYALKDKLFTLTTKVNRALEEVRAKKEKQRVKEQLVKSEKYFRSIIENSADGIALLDAEMNIVDISPNCKKIVGFDREELLGKFPASLFYPEDIPVILDAFSSALKNPDTAQLVQYRSKKKEGGYVWIEANYINRLNDPDINAIILNYRDVSDKKRVEEEIRKLNAELEDRVKERTSELLDANAALEAFSYSVSHDLRSPLRSILGFTKIIQHDYHSAFTPELQELFEHISTSSKRMNDIIADLLALAKYGNEKLVLDDIDMSGLFNRVWNEADMASKNNPVLQIGPLPHITADVSMMEQVVVNLLSNSVKYSSKKQNPIVQVGFEEAEGA
ncbi:MAG: hypothetical protein JWO06_3686, partial [Bacteroidota bacterium]|nr:hypothetical protein [Bacteroidota bacterium]